MRNFRELNVWQEGIQLVKKIYILSKAFPNDEIYGLTSQIQRAAVSIPSNIAEGCSRNSNAEFKRYLEIAIGSSYELESQILIIQELDLLNNYNFDEIFIQINKLQKMLNKFISQIKNFKPIQPQNLIPKT